MLFLLSLILTSCDFFSFLKKTPNMSLQLPSATFQLLVSHLSLIFIELLFYICYHSKLFCDIYVYCVCWYQNKEKSAISCYSSFQASCSIVKERVYEAYISAYLPIIHVYELLRPKINEGLNLGFPSFIGIFIHCLWSGKTHNAQLIISGSLFHSSFVDSAGVHPGSKFSYVIHQPKNHHVRSSIGSSWL